MGMCVCGGGSVSGLRILSGSFERCLFAFLSGSGIEFHYYVMELSLLHILHASPVVGPGIKPGMCLQAGGRWAGQPLGWSSEALGKAEAGRARDRSWLCSSSKIQKALQSYFPKMRPENTE